MNNIVRTKILIVGSGGNGISCGAHFKRAGLDEFVIITRHSDFGGVWYQNRYPGCCTDLPVQSYQLRFAQRLLWPQTHATSSQMREYLQEVAAENDLYRHAHFDTELLEAEWLDEEACWRVKTNKRTYYAEFLLPATGCLDEPSFPEIPGIDAFKGRKFHSAQWPEEYTGANDRIAVVGSSSSAVQIIAAVQKIAAKVVVLQRSPSFVVPLLDKKVFTQEELAEHERNPGRIEQQRQQVKRVFDQLWTDVLFGRDPELIAKMEREVLEYIGAQVLDPELRKLVTPHGGIAARRMTMNDDYYSAIQKPNVELVPEAAAAVGEHSVITASGREIEVDTVVFATGFVVMGSVLSRVNRRDGVIVRQYQKGHPRAYKATSIAGCPNMFLVACAPNSIVWDGFHGGMTHPVYVMKALEYMQEHGIRALEVKEEEELAWKKKTDELLDHVPTARVKNSIVKDETGHNKAFWPGTPESMTAAHSVFDPAAYNVVA